jgi:hypothetical protein
MGNVMGRKILIACLFMSFTGAASAGSCYEANIVKPSPFMGTDGEILKLSDGTLWEVKYEYEYMYEYNPEVIICPSAGKLHVKGKKLNVEKMN